MVFAPAPRRAAPATREAEFLARAAGLQAVRLRRLVLATTTLERLTAYGPAAHVWRVAGGQDGYWTLDGLPAAR